MHRLTVYATTNVAPLGLCFLRDAISFSASSRVWETQRKIPEYSGCASVFVNKSMRWRHRLTVYATAEEAQTNSLCYNKLMTEMRWIPCPPLSLLIVVSTVFCENLSVTSFQLRGNRSWGWLVIGGTPFFFNC